VPDGFAALHEAGDVVGHLGPEFDQFAAEPFWPVDHLRAAAHDRHDRRRSRVTEPFVDDLDA
jgi:hypothetical protein